MTAGEAKRKLQHELYLKMNKDEADRLIDKIESYVSQVRSEEREKQRKPLASVIIKPTCIETHGGENEAFEAAAEELRKRYILWALGEKPRQFTFEMYVDEYHKKQSE